MIEQQQNNAMEIKLKQLLYSTINNNDFDLFETNKNGKNGNNINPIVIGFNGLHTFDKNKYEGVVIERYNKSVVSEFRPYSYDLKKYIDVYNKDFKIIYPDGEPDLRFEYQISDKRKEINLPWYKRMFGFEHYEVTTTFIYKLILGELIYILNDIEVEEIFSILRVKYENHLNKLQDEKHKTIRLKLDTRLELYKNKN
jgi:hypothetical protein